jgi:nitrite transporter NirC
MFTFITCGYEHSVANMCGLLLGLFLPHSAFPGITWDGYAYNLVLATLGNIVGGALFVAGMYWLGSAKARELAWSRKKPEVAVDEVTSPVLVGTNSAE